MNESLAVLLFVCAVAAVYLLAACALVTLSKFGKRFESGLHRVGETWLYVTRGVGMEGGTAPRVRFFARPEVTVIELAPAAD